MSNNIDTQILELINNINKRKQEISELEKPNWATNRNLTSINFNFNIKKTISELVLIGSSLQNLKDACQKFTDDNSIDIKNNPVLLDGFPVNDWIRDILITINIQKISKKKEELEKIQQRLNQIVSPELRAKLELEAIRLEISNI